MAQAPGGSASSGSSGSTVSASASSTSSSIPSETIAVATSSATPAEVADALEEVRMAVEQLVIPHQEAVELLPRDDRLLAMQAELISREYKLEYEECGEGSAKRIRILHTYAKQ
uniref:R3H domain-containing protein n=1 Tax=Mantoniella antarctica TaxID=81844 RepID=A0A7S0SSM6_9CHLO